MIKIGIIRETKLKTDSRAALTPEDVAYLQSIYNGKIKIYVQPSDIRAFTDEEYRNAGAFITNNMNECDYLFGIKEALPASLIPNKHYFFFGHIREDKPYNIPLLREMVNKNVTFSDYEIFGTGYDRLTAFSYYAGIVGAYNTIRLYGIKNKCYLLEAPGYHFSVDKLMRNIEEISKILIAKKAKFVITGNGVASAGAKTALSATGLKFVNTEEFIKTSNPSYTIAKTRDTVRNKDGNISYQRSHYYDYPECYESDFVKFSNNADALIACHSWEPNQPILFGNKEILSDSRRMNVIGDVVCDINGSLRTTIRHSSHSAPFYDVHPVSLSEIPSALGNEKTISVMAVDTLPNALPRESSIAFSKDLTRFVIMNCIMSNDNVGKIRNATIVKNGKITEKFNGLNNLLH